jgi:hypothetical protein
MLPHTVSDWQQEVLTQPDKSLNATDELLEASKTFKEISIAVLNKRKVMKPDIEGFFLAMLKQESDLWKADNIDGMYIPFKTTIHDSTKLPTVVCLKYLTFKVQITEPTEVCVRTSNATHIAYATLKDWKNTCISLLVSALVLLGEVIVNDSNCDLVDD